jgi:hypothetical protein
MILLHLIVAERQVGAASHLDIFDKGDSLLLRRDHWILIHLEEHLHPQQCFVVMGDRMLIILLLHAQVPVEALDVGDFELLLIGRHRIVLDDDLLIFGANGLLVIELLTMRTFIQALQTILLAGHLFAANS